jgi:oxygen-independent coproporphyrinogen-3 oxidase
MVGLGAGARSYTRRLHYSTPWRMLGKNIRAVVEEYVRDHLSTRGHRVRHGFVLDDDEQDRRWALQSLLAGALDLADFAAARGADAVELFAPQWAALEAEGCVRRDGGLIRLTERGTRHADAVGQLFFSERVRRLMAEHEYDT